eukprot:1144235-Pelagomonas_calceolata.AAC.5
MNHVCLGLLFDGIEPAYDRGKVLYSERPPMLVSMLTAGWLAALMGLPNPFLAIDGASSKTRLSLLLYVRHAQGKEMVI